MNPMSLFSKKTAISTELIFDIESDSVGVTVVRYESGKAPRIVYSDTLSVGRKAHTDGDYLTHTMLKTLDLAAQTASTALSGLIEKQIIDRAKMDDIHVVLSSPWIISKLSCVEEKFEKETVIRRSTIAGLLEKERAASSELFAAGDSAAVDTKLFEIKVNGYPVAEYEGKRATALEGTLVVAFASRKLLADIKSAINRHFRSHGESFHSAIILRYIALRSAMPRHADFAWIQVHGELSDTLVVHEGACAVSGSLPFGTDSLARILPYHSSANLAGQEHPAIYVDEKAGLATEKALKEWAEGVFALLAAGERSLSVPLVYVSGHVPPAIFAETLKKLRPEIDVRVADPAVMAPFVEYAPSVAPELSDALFAAALPLSQAL